METLDDLFDFDMTVFGFDEPVDDEPVEIVEDDYEIAPPEEPKAKRGDIYKLGRHRLMCGDSTDVENLEKLFDSNNIDLVLTDPPYGVDVVSDDGKVGADFGIAQKGNYMAVKGDDTVETAQMFYNAVAQTTKKQIIFGGNYFTEFLPHSTGWLIWDKRCDSGIKNTFADGEMAWCSFHTPVRIYHQLWNGMIREGEHEKRVHPTQKPVRMLGDILRDFSAENDNIFDGFGGSGSTLMACEQTGRNCFMIEYEPHYIDLIIARWEQFTGEKAILLNR